MFFSRNKTRGNEYLAVFLGNPGGQYDGTRHNTGFMAADVLADREHLKINKVKFKGLWCRWDFGGSSVIVLKPTTYMNLSGEAVRACMDFFKIPRQRVIVVYDDVSLPLGKIRIRTKGSAGGHNGIKSIISHSGGEDFPRIKIGVGSVPEHYDMVDWVMKKYTAEEYAELKPALEKSANALRCMISEGAEKAMNRYSS